MKWLVLALSLATVVRCHILANGDSLEVHTVMGGAVTVKLEYPPVGAPIPNCCSDTTLLQQPVLAGTIVTEVAHLRDMGYLLRLDFVENIVTCHLVPDVDTNDLSSILCPHLACPAGWNLLQGTCFLVSQVSGSWEEGETFCQQQGGALATISSSLQQVALSDLLTNDTWIGLRHHSDKQTYGWTDGTEHTYTSWTQKEPSISQTTDRKECVEMQRRHNYLWDAAHCHESRQYLCSVPGSVINVSGRSKSHCSTTTTTTPSTTTITTTPTAIQECSSGWDKHQSSCYKAFKIRTNYSSATATCKALGGHLATISNEGENSFMAGLVDTYTYIGLNDEAVEGVFTWQDGSPFHYSKWLSGQPNNSGGNQDCVVISIDSTWHDVPCENNYHYICEKSLQ